MAEMKNFNREFVERTIEILNNYYSNTEYEITLLLNFLLAMVTLPIELQKNNTNKNAKKFKIDCVTKLKELSTIKQNCNDDTIFENIRNAIAHLNINIENSNNKVEKIILKNLANKNFGTCTLKISISPNNLKKFMEYVANECINRFCK